MQQHIKGQLLYFVLTTKKGGGKDTYVLSPSRLLQTCRW